MEQSFAQEYGNLEEWHWWFRGRREILAAILSRKVGRKDSLSIASLGCGPAEGLAWLLPLAGPGGAVVGVDADPLHARRISPRQDFIVGRMEDVPLPSASFDLVLALDVLEHLDDDAAGLGEAFRLVRPGGLLVVTVPALPSLWGGQDIVSHHRRRYTKASLRRLFARAALPPPRVSYFNTLLFPVVAGLRWGRRAVGLGNRARSDFDDSRPGMLNEILTSVFAAERHLVGHLPLPVGASLVALSSHTLEAA